VFQSLGQRSTFHILGWKGQSSRSRGLETAVYRQTYSLSHIQFGFLVFESMLYVKWEKTKWWTHELWDMLTDFRMTVAGLRIFYRYSLYCIFRKLDHLSELLSDLQSEHMISDCAEFRQLTPYIWNYSDVACSRCHRLSLPGGLSLPEAAITIAGTNPYPEP